MKVAAEYALHPPPPVKRGHCRSVAPPRECRAMSQNIYASHYRTGEDIRAGDRGSWAGRPGRVVFVLGSPDFPTE